MSPDGVTSAVIENWMRPMDVIAVVRIRKARHVKRFFDHLRTLRVVATNPVPAALLATGKQRLRRQPFIFTPQQVVTILNAAGRLPASKKFPHRVQTCVTMLTLLCALGLRHGEVRRLRLRDVNLARQRCSSTRPSSTRAGMSRSGRRSAAAWSGILPSAARPSPQSAKTT